MISIYIDTYIISMTRFFIVESAPKRSIKVHLHNQIIKSLHPSPQLIIGFVKTTPPSPLELVRILKKTSKLIS